MKTKFASYCSAGIPKGCEKCVKGEKLVLFITGKCSRCCYYCSLSSKRKNIDVIYANERQCVSPEQAVEEARESRATGAGITGGDPLLFLDRTIEYAKALKNSFKKFHIHIYLPTNLVSEENLSKLHQFIDEVRFHPSFLQKPDNETEKAMEEDIEKLKTAGKIYKKENIGCEMPAFPDKKLKMIKFIKKAAPFIGFANLNELEISETNFSAFTEKYNFNEDTYTIAGSIEAGKEILGACKNLGIKIHLCTAETKIAHQFGSRLRRTKALPYSERDKEGMAFYFAIYCETDDKLEKAEQELKGSKFRKIYSDKSKNRIIISEKLVPNLLKSKILKKLNLKISRVKEYPTFDRTEVEILSI